MGKATVCLAVVLACLGCDKQEAGRAARKLTDRLAKEYEDSKVLLHVKSVLGAVESRDLGRLKGLCTDPNSADYTSIMTCYYSAFATEDRDGPAAARKLLAAEAASAATPAKRKAVAALQSYFAAKGSLRTREVAGVILVIALEAKYPHRGGALGGIVAKALGLLPATAPAGPTGSP